jgi:hypothetical protein
MQHINRCIAVIAITVGLQLFGCGLQHDERHVQHPAEVEHIEGTKLSRVILTERAMERLDVQTDKVGEAQAQKVVPYSALIYDTHGQTWVYTSPQQRTFVRHAVTVDRIEGDTAYLSEGPPAGTVVATVAVIEIYGTEYAVGH